MRTTQELQAEVGAHGSQLDGSSCFSSSGRQLSKQMSLSQLAMQLTLIGDTEEGSRNSGKLQAFLVTQFMSEKTGTENKGMLACSVSSLPLYSVEISVYGM